MGTWMEPQARILIEECLDGEGPSVVTGRPNAGSIPPNTLRVICPGAEIMPACLEPISARHAKREDTVHEKLAELKAKLPGARGTVRRRFVTASSNPGLTGAWVPPQNQEMPTCRSTQCSSGT